MADKHQELALQWGLDQMIEEMSTLGAMRRSLLASSMGPRSDDPGNQHDATLHVPLPLRLQWDLDQMIEEMLAQGLRSFAVGNLQWGLDQMIEEMVTAPTVQTH